MGKYSLLLVGLGVGAMVVMGRARIASWLAASAGKAVDDARKKDAATAEGIARADEKAEAHRRRADELADEAADGSATGEDWHLKGKRK